jgi:hypothetical protein
LVFSKRASFQQGSSRLTGEGTPFSLATYPFFPAQGIELLRESLRIELEKIPGQKQPRLATAPGGVMDEWALSPSRSRPAC